MHLWIKEVECGSGNMEHMKTLKSWWSHESAWPLCFRQANLADGPSMGMNCAYSQSHTGSRMEATLLFWQQH